MEEVKAVIAKLYENRKIANATHNMYAYRISQSKGTLYIIILEIYILHLFLCYQNWTVFRDSMLVTGVVIITFENSSWNGSERVEYFWNY